jgi:peptide/nickel transport system permease protein
MPFKLDLLWTDWLVWMLVLAAAAYAAYVLRWPHLRAPWQRVARSRAGMSALTMLAFFVVIGLADSIHYRTALPSGDGRPAGHSSDLRSLLDAFLEPLRVRREKTYSAPLATHLFARETVTLADGGETREYPRLRHGGAHLDAAGTGWGEDIIWRTVAGLAGGAIAWAFFALLIAYRVSRHRSVGLRRAWLAIARAETELPWRAVLVTLAAMLAAGGVVVSLAGAYHVLGTDKVGQDVLFQALKSVRTALVIGTLTTLIMLPFALLFGIMAGYFRGRVDDVIQYFYTTLSSIPGVLLIAAAVLMMQVYIETHPELFPTTELRADMRLLSLCAILGITSWTSLCRLLRGEALKLREMEYIQAAQAFGVSHWGIMARHLLPNVMHIVLIAVVMDFSGLVLAEAVLSYVGVGVDPSMISYGTMINNARLEMAREPMVWWSLAAAFVFMLLLVLSANLFADAVRDAFDPRIATSSIMVAAPQKA